MILPPSQNTVGVCNQITFLIIYCTSSRLVTLLKFTDAPAHVSDIFNLIIIFKFINFSFQIFLLSVPEMSASFVLHCLDYLNFF